MGHGSSSQFDMSEESKDEVKRMNKEYCGKILSLTAKDAEKHGIKKLQLVRMKNKIRKGNQLKLSAKSKRRLERAMP